MSPGEICTACRFPVCLQITDTLVRRECVPWASGCNPRLIPHSSTRITSGADMREIEHRAFTLSVLAIQPEPDGPDMLWPQCASGAKLPACVPRRSIFDPIFLQNNLLVRCKGVAPACPISMVSDRNETDRFRIGRAARRRQLGRTHLRLF
jgi:hypothetical protein